MRVMRDLPNNFDEARNLQLLLVLCRLDAEQRRLAVDVEERLHQVVLRLVDEALACFLEDLALHVSGLLEHLDVLSRRDLTLLFDPLLVFERAHLMAVGEHIVFARLANEVFQHIILRD